MKPHSNYLPTTTSSEPNIPCGKPAEVVPNLLTTAAPAPPAPTSAEETKHHSPSSMKLAPTTIMSSLGNSGPVAAQSLNIAGDGITGNPVKPLTPPSPEKPLAPQTTSYFNPPSLAKRAFQKELTKLPLYSYLDVNANRRAHYIRSSKDFQAYTDRFISEG